ncbi:MAG: hypothetical protein NC299_16500 [Lachnospiraceae bacterium]|nr:hypothetical protein [Ruminococcus sp.]MCM1276937.1 hypothetical protein [Lachnospiraceae bacterium]
MSKLFKKITAAVMTAVITSSAFALCANAASEEKTFSTRYVNSPTYIPSEVNYAAEVRLEASTEQYTGVVTHMSEIVSRSATITCTSHTFYDTMLPIEFNAKGSRTWRISGRIGDGVKAVYKVSARTNVYGTLNVEGKILRG